MNKKNTYKVLSMLLVSTVFLTLFSGCIGEEKEETPAPTTAAPTTAAPTTAAPTTAAPTTAAPEEKEHVFTYTFYETMATWDPSITFDSTIAMAGECYETLTFYDQSADPPLQPKLATSWEQSENKLTWTFHLRKGVKFHTGREMTAKDVEYSIERVVDMGKGAAFIWIGLKDIEVIDTYTVAFHTENAMNIPVIASASYAACIYDSKEVESKGDYDEQTAWFQQGNECGTGPYYVDSWSEMQQTVFKKFDDYWRGWEGNYFETCIMKYVVEGSTNVLMAESGEAQLVPNPPIAMISRLDGHEDLKVVGMPSYMNMVIEINCKKPPTDELAVRKALEYTWDYETVVEEIWQGYATIAKTCVPKGIWGIPEDLPTYSFDPEKAKQILEDAGWKDTNGDGIREKDGKDLKMEIITTTGHVTYRESTEYWQTILKEVGFSVDLNVIPWDTAWTRSKTFETSPNVFTLGWWPTMINPNDMLYSMFHSSQIGVFNCSFYENLEFDETIEEAQKKEGTDMEKAAELYGESMRMLYEDAAGIWAWDRESIYVVHKSIEGFSPNPAYPYVIFLYNVRWKK